MVPPNLYFWSISRKESLESKQKHALRISFLRTLLCSNDTFNPGYNRKMLIRKRMSILDGVCVNYEQFFHPVQRTACRICQCSSRDKLVLPKVTGCSVTFRSASLSLRYKLLLYRYMTIFNLSESVWKFTHTFLLPLYFVHFRRDISSLESVFSMSGNCCISTTVNVSFSGEVFGVLSTT